MIPCLIDRRYYLAVVLTLLCLTYCSQGQGNPSAQEAAPEISKWAYIIPESFRATQFANRLKQYDILCLGVYRLNQRGLLYRRAKLSQANWLQLARSRQHKKLYPLISLRGSRDGAIMLKNIMYRQRAIQELLSLMHEPRVQGFDGIHIDFEFLTGKSKAHFVAFLKELRSGMQKQSPGAHLSIAAFPPLHGQPEEKAFWDLKQISPNVDSIVFMTYDYHFYKPGPVTHLYWARLNIQEVLKSMPVGKAWLGVPGYGYSWKPGQKRPSAVWENEGHKQCQQFGCERHDSGMLRVKRNDRVVYFSDAELRRSMSKLASEYKMRGTALWRVGFEHYP